MVYICKTITKMENKSMKIIANKPRQRNIPNILLK